MIVIIELALMAEAQSSKSACFEGVDKFEQKF